MLIRGKLREDAKKSEKILASNNHAAPSLASGDTCCDHKDVPSITRACSGRLRYFPKDRAPSQLRRKDPLYVPSSIRCPEVLDPFGREAIAPVQSWGCSPAYSMRFSWLDQQKNNNSGESSSRKVAAKETSRREVENWYHMHFRFRMEGYQSLVYAVKQSVKDESIFSEEHIDKWTLKLRFCIRRSSPLKEALVACVSRLGLDCFSDVMFCLDGFYGDALTGRIHNRNEIPNRIAQPTSTCRAMGLGNGSCLFVSRATKSERANASIQMQLDMLRNLEAEVSSDATSDEPVVRNQRQVSTLDLAIARASIVGSDSAVENGEDTSGLESIDLRLVSTRKMGSPGLHSESDNSADLDMFGRYGHSSRKR